MIRDVRTDHGRILAIASIAGPGMVREEPQCRREDLSGEGA